MAECMDEPKLDPQRSREYHVLVEGQMHGPFTAESLKAALETGDVTPEDLVQVGGLPIWRPLRQVLESPLPRFESELPPQSVSPSLPEVGAAAVPPPLPHLEPSEVEQVEEGELVESFPMEESSTPDWKTIRQQAWARVRAHFEERSVGTGLICLGLGLVAFLVSLWPALIWLPWFGLAFFAGFDALKRGKTLQGVGLLVAACALPIAFSTLLSVLRPRPVEPVLLQSNGPSEPISPVTVAPAQIPEPVSPTENSASSSRATAPVVIESLEPAPAPPLTVPSPKSAPPVPSNPNPAPLPAPPLKAPPIGTVPPAAKIPQASIPVEIQAVKPPEPIVPLFNSADPNSANTIVGGDFVQQHRDCFVVVQDGGASGSGFICRSGQKTWLFTNVHVAAGMRNPKFSRLDGAQLKVASAEAGGTRDVVRLEVTDAVQPLDILPNLDASVRIGDDVVVLGNSGGGGVVTTLSGKLVGIGPDRIEVTAEFIPGNSGSPIIHVPTGKVIGIATYLTRRYDEFAGAESKGVRTQDGATVRRFGYRLDQIERWEPVNWAVFRGEAEQLRQISVLTADVFDFLDAVRERQEPQFATDTLRRPATEWLTGIRRQKISEVDRNRFTQNFLSSLRFMVRADVSAAENRIRYSYFRERLQKEREVRDRLYKAFDDDVKKMTSPSLR